MSKKICLHTQNAPEAIGPYSQAISLSVSYILSSIFYHSIGTNAFLHCFQHTLSAGLQIHTNNRIIGRIHHLISYHYTGICIWHDLILLPGLK